MPYPEHALVLVPVLLELQADFGCVQWQGKDLQRAAQGMGMGGLAAMGGHAQWMAHRALTGVASTPSPTSAVHAAMALHANILWKGIGGPVLAGAILSAAGVRADDEAAYTHARMVTDFAFSLLH